MTVIKLNKKFAFVFDLDKTIGFFTQFAIFMEGIESIIGRKLKKKEFFKLLDLYPEYFRPTIFEIFEYLRKLKKENKGKVKILIYTNNMGPKSWVYDIADYIEYKIKGKIFDKIIPAWKVDKLIYSNCRTTHDKTYKDVIKCGNIDKDATIFFFEDTRYPNMLRENINYFYLYPYKYELVIEKMIMIFEKSKLFNIIKNKKKNFFKTDILNFVQNDPLGFRYIEHLDSNSDRNSIEDKRLLSKIIFYIKKDNHKSKKFRPAQDSSSKKYYKQSNKKAGKSNLSKKSYIKMMRSTRRKKSKKRKTRKIRK